MVTINDWTLLLSFFIFNFWTQNKPLPAEVTVSVLQEEVCRENRRNKAQSWRCVFLSSFSYLDVFYAAIYKTHCSSLGSVMFVYQRLTQLLYNRIITSIWADQGYSRWWWLIIKLILWFHKKKKYVVGKHTFMVS